MYYTVYKTTNMLSGKFYIGTHKTTKLDDDYMGSGKYLKRAIEKHGLENFTKEVLFTYDNPEEMFAKERELVNADFISEENTYNLKIGGNGGWDYLNSNGINNSNKTPEQLKRGGLIHAEKLKTDSDYAEKHRIRSSENMKKAHKTGKINYNTFQGKTHSEETKQKMRESQKKVKRVGKDHPFFGIKRKFINKEGQVKRILYEELDNYLNDGWKLGLKK